jgi:uncharacterized protein YjbI with pentapeptide repeats
MRGIDLANTDLRGLSFSQSDMTACNLEGANLSEAQLAETIIIQANLKDTELFASHLFRVIAKQTDIKGANMYLTDLRFAQLTEFHGLSQVQLDFSIADTGTKLQEGLSEPALWLEWSKAEELQLHREKTSEETEESGHQK